MVSCCAYRWDEFLFNVQEGRGNLKLFIESTAEEQWRRQGNWPERSECSITGRKGSVVATIKPFIDVADCRIDISYSM